MRIFNYFECENQKEWIDKIGRCDWSAARFLAELLSQNRFDETLGEGGKLFLMADGENLVSFATLTKIDCVKDNSLYPWIGFVFTHPDYRGHRYSGDVIESACIAAKVQGYSKVYLATDHIGLYEHYGFEYMETRTDIYGEESRIYCKGL